MWKHLTVTCAAAALLFAAPDTDKREKGRLIVQHRKGADSNKARAVIAAQGGRPSKTIEALDLEVIEVPDGAIEAVAATLDASGLFNFVEPDYTATGAATPSDPYFPSAWHLSRIQAPSAWNYTVGSSTPIAILDSGVDSSHPDLAGRIMAGWNFVNNNSNTSDVRGHGTGVTGVVAAATNNGIGVAGVTWGNPIMPLLVLDANNYASYSNVAAAITYAADRGVRVISLSLGGTSASSTLQSAVDYAWNRGAIVVAAAGNSSSTTPWYPANCDKAIAVAATDQNDAKASFSNYGSWISVSAPGDYIWSTTSGGGYGQWWGTSLATPIVSGVAALTLAVKPSLSAAALVDLIEKNADDLGSAGFDDSFGWGRVNAYRTVSAAAAVSPDATAPGVSISTPGNGATVSGTVYVQGAASDNVGVTRVEFYVNGNLANTSYSTSFSFPWNSTAAPNGWHSLQVRAYDLAGNAGQSTVSVYVNNVVATADVIAPVAVITSPANGITVGRSVTISVSASDNVGVTQVAIYIDGVLRYTDSTAPYSWSWGTRKVSSGWHTITVKAWDAAGNVSAPVSISVLK